MDHFIESGYVRSWERLRMVLRIGIGFKLIGKLEAELQLILVECWKMTNLSSITFLSNEFINKCII